jgi:hypothetical protein
MDPNSRRTTSRAIWPRSRSSADLSDTPPPKGLDQKVGSAIRCMLFELMPFKKAWTIIHLMRCKTANVMIFKSFLVNAALAHNLYQGS